MDADTKYTCIISISCETILDNIDKCVESKKALVPEDGIILPATEVTFSDGESVYDVLQRVCKANTNDPAAYGGQFKEILDEQTFLKEKRSVILANNNEQTKANQRIMDAAQTLENASLHITEWDESAVRQLVETVKILSKDEVAVTLKGGIEICQKIMY